jgi:hypothetical protein
MDRPARLHENTLNARAGQAFDAFVLNFRKAILDGDPARTAPSAREMDHTDWEGSSGFSKPGTRLSRAECE